MKSFIDKYMSSAALLMMAADAGAGFNIDGDFSLAEFADQDTSDIKELDSLLPPMGVFYVKITTAKLGENPPKEGLDPKTGMPYPKLIYTGYKYQVLQALPADKSIDADTWTNRVLSERHTFWPAQLKDSIGLLKGRYKKVGFENSGRMGGVEGGEPGWIDGAEEKIIGLKCKHIPKNGSSIAVYDWFKVEVEGEADDSAAA